MIDFCVDYELLSPLYHAHGITQPVPQARPRVGRGGGFDPEKSKIHKRVIKDACEDAMRSRNLVMLPAKTPLKLLVIARRHDFRVADSDNILKGVADSLSKVAYADDNWVWDMRIQVQRFRYKKGRAKFSSIYVRIEPMNKGDFFIFDTW